MDDCIFKSIGLCSQAKSDTKLSTNGISRIKTIIEYSKQYGDNLYRSLEELITKACDESNLTIRSHRHCVSSYCHKKNLKHTNTEFEGNPSPAKRQRRSLTPVFQFREHCVFCGETCVVDIDKKHPDRFIPAFQFRQIEKLGCKGCTKEDIYHACKIRNDKWAGEVQARIDVAISDLHAADARYHVHCKGTFMSTFHLKKAEKKTQIKVSEATCQDSGFEHVVNTMNENKSRIWNSIELHKLYCESESNSGLSKRFLIQKLKESFGEKLLVLTSNGLASIVVLRSEAPSLMKLVPDSDESAIDSAIEKLSQTIAIEVKSLNISKKQYSSHLSNDLVEESMSHTLLAFLANLSGKLDHTLPAYLIGSIVTSVMINFPTMLQISLGVLMRSSKKLIDTMHEYGVTCSYTEVLRFKKSAALSATSSAAMQGISNASGGLIQVVVDNFDADIASQNGKISTHSLAILLTQPQKESILSSETQIITRANDNEMKLPINYDFTIQHYSGPKRSQMPQDKAVRSVLSLKMLANMLEAKKRSTSIDTCFLRDIVTLPNCPEFSGYNTRISREQGKTTQTATKAVYLPLIDMTPSDPDTMMTAMQQAQVLTRQCCQQYVVFTCDLQLYRVAVNIIWALPEQFGDVVLRLGGMHTLMSFVGSIGTLMAGSGLTEILESTFGGVGKMLNGKKFPQNVRALRILTEELLRPLLEDEINETVTLNHMISKVTGRSRTAKVWADILVKGVLIMMMFIRAEREADWYLHMCSLADMIPFFFAAGHANYARYALYYLRSMEKLPPALLKQFLDGQHVMRHIPGRFNGIWSDMFIESTFMRYGHGKRGIIGITLKPDTIKTWSLSLHLCSQIEQDLVSLGQNEHHCSDMHKEEMKSRIAADKTDRESIRKKLDGCIHPFKPSEHPPELINIVTGRKASSAVNVDNAVSIGIEQMREFEKGWPQSFHESIKRSVKTQIVDSKLICIGGERSFDTELIYSRVIGIQASGRDIDLNMVLSYELAPVPTAMFEKSGVQRSAKNKCKLKDALKKEISSRQPSRKIDNVVIDGSAILYIISWPKTGTVNDYLVKYRKYIDRQLVDHNVYIVFDRYREYSTKSATRLDRGGGVPAVSLRIHRLSPSMAIPPQRELLTVPENKKQLIALICDDLSSNTSFPVTTSDVRKLVITGEDDYPLEISESVKIRRDDMRTSHEEADNIIVQQMVSVSKESRHGVKIISDDTDVFILALFHYQQQEINIPVIMESPVQGRTIIDINATADTHSDILVDLLAAHAISGCDTVPSYYGIGKGKVVKVLNTKKHSLKSLGNVNAEMKIVEKESSEFIASCYGVENAMTMSNARIKTWSKKAGKTAVSAPKLETLPPTTEAFRENVKRAHFQACVWKHALDPDPPAMDPLDYGWFKDEQEKMLLPVLLPSDVHYAPHDILKMIKCSCGSQAPCSSMKCHCNNARLSCTVFCACRGESICCNEQTK